MDRDTLVWFGLALIAALAATPALLAGGFPLAPLLIAAVGLACAVHGGSRTRVITAARRLLSKGALKTTLVVLGALMLIQLLPVELALLMAGDVLAYVEVLAAVGLIAANTRVRVIRAMVRQKIDQWRNTAQHRTGRRAPRSLRPVRPRRPSSRDEEPAGLCVFA